VYRTNCGTNTSGAARRTLHSGERIFYGEFDGKRRKRVLVKIIGE